MRPEACGGEMTECSESSAVFPAGLEQPEGSFRFSADALLLASFAGELLRREEGMAADLGTGCGVAALAFLRERPLWRAVGVELLSPLAEAARRNACRLGMMCNPPWRRVGEGRLPPSGLRRTALFGTEKTFRDFFLAADTLLEQGGLLAVVSGAERTAELLFSLPPRLHAERLQFVFTREDAPAAFVLLGARKNGRAALRVEKRTLPAT